MTRNVPRPAFEALEGRTLLSLTLPIIVSPPVKNAATKTTLSAVAGTLAHPVTFTVTVRAAAAAGSPTGTVNILDHGTVLDTVTLSATSSNQAKYAFSEGTYTLVQSPGGADYYFGKHAVTAAYVPAGTFAKSAAAGSFTVTKPTYAALADGVETETVIAGSGAAVASGQTADVLYTGYLEKNGHIFDDSVNDGATPFSYTVGAGQVITGFDEGTVGMQVGETRLVLIPPAEGYGSTTNGSIPKNSTLLFVITLESIS